MGETCSDIAKQMRKRRDCDEQHIAALQENVGSPIGRLNKCSSEVSQRGKATSSRDSPITSASVRHFVQSFHRDSSQGFGFRLELITPILPLKRTRDFAGLIDCRITGWSLPLWRGESFHRNSVAIHIRIQTENGRATRPMRGPNGSDREVLNSSHEARKQFDEVDEAANHPPDWLTNPGSDRRSIRLGYEGRKIARSCCGLPPRRQTQ